MRMIPRSITGRLLAAMLAVFLLTMALQYIAYYENLESRRGLSRAYLRSTARAAAATTDDAIQDTISDLRTAWLHAWPDVPADRIIAQLRSLHPPWAGAGCLDTKTGSFLSKPADLTPEARQWLVEAGMSARPRVSRVLMADSGGFLVSIPITAKDGRIVVAYAAVPGAAIRDAVGNVTDPAAYVRITDSRRAVVCSAGTNPVDRRPLRRMAALGAYTPDGHTTASATCSFSDWQVSVIDPKGLTAAGDKTWFVRSMVISLLAAGLALLLGKRIVNPIRKLSRAAAAVAVGDFRRRVAINTGDELQSLASSFNQMAENLEAHEIQLRAKTQVQQTLFDLARTISSSIDLDKVADSISTALRELFAAEQVVVFRLDELSGRLEPLLAQTEGVEALQRLAEHAIGSPTAISVPSSLEYSGGLVDEGVVVAVPLIAGDQRVGVLAAKLSLNESWDAERQSRAELLEAFSSWAAVALRNADIHRRTEDFMRMLDSLRLVINAISSSLDLKQVLRALVRTTTQVMNAKACAILLANEDGRLEVAQSHNLGKEFRDKLKVHPGENWTGVAFSEKKPVARTDICAEEHFPIREDAEKEGLHGLICAPLLIGEQAIGTINVWMAAPHIAKSIEVHLLSSIASHAAAVIANAKLFGKEYQIAETLQNTLKGEVPERIGRLSFGYKYLPALDEASVGGDLYDVISLPDGRVGLIVADVVGKGIQAAVHTAMVRHMGRAYLFENPDSPAGVLSKLNEAAVHFAGTGLVVTVFCAVVDAATGWAVYANAGHPPALVLTQQGRQQVLLYRTGMPIGCNTRSDYSDRNIDLKPGDTMVIYTDGITEARDNGTMLNVEGLEDILFRHADLGPVAMVETICEETRCFANHELTDDIALIAAGFDIGSRKDVN